MHSAHEIPVSKFKHHNNEHYFMVVTSEFEAQTMANLKGQKNSTSDYFILLLDVQPTAKQGKPLTNVVLLNVELLYEQEQVTLDDICRIEPSENVIVQQPVTPLVKYLRQRNVAYSTIKFGYWFKEFKKNYFKVEQVSTEDISFDEPIEKVEQLIQAHQKQKYGPTALPQHKENPIVTTVASSSNTYTVEPVMSQAATTTPPSPPPPPPSIPSTSLSSAAFAKITPASTSAPQTLATRQSINTVRIPQASTVTTVQKSTDDVQTIESPAYGSELFEEISTPAIPQAPSNTVKPTTQPASSTQNRTVEQDKVTITPAPQTRVVRQAAVAAAASIAADCAKANHNEKHHTASSSTAPAPVTDDEDEGQDVEELEEEEDYIEKQPKSRKKTASKTRKNDVPKKQQSKKQKKKASEAKEPKPKKAKNSKVIQEQTVGPCTRAKANSEKLENIALVERNLAPQTTTATPTPAPTIVSAPVDASLQQLPHVPTASSSTSVTVDSMNELKHMIQQQALQIANMQTTMQQLLARQHETYQQPPLQPYNPPPQQYAYNFSQQPPQQQHYQQPYSQPAVVCPYQPPYPPSQPPVATMIL